MDKLSDTWSDHFAFTVTDHSLSLLWLDVKKKIFLCHFTKHADSYYD